MQSNSYAGESDEQILKWFALLFPKPPPEPEPRLARFLEDDDDYDDFDEDDDDDGGDKKGIPSANVDPSPNLPQDLNKSNMSPSVRAAATRSRRQLWDRIHDPVAAQGPSPRKKPATSLSQSPSPPEGQGPQRRPMESARNARFDPMRGRPGPASGQRPRTPLPTAPRGSRTPLPSGRTGSRTPLPTARGQRPSRSTRPLVASPLGPPAPSQISGNLPVHGRAVVPSEDLDVDMTDVPESTLPGGVGAASSDHPGGVPRNSHSNVRYDFSSQRP